MNRAVPARPNELAEWRPCRAGVRTRMRARQTVLKPKHWNKLSLVEKTGGIIGAVPNWGKADQSRVTRRNCLSCRDLGHVFHVLARQSLNRLQEFFEAS